MKFSFSFIINIYYSMYKMYKIHINNGRQSFIYILVIKLLIN